MKQYKKPVVEHIDISKDDIIQTSSVTEEGLLPGEGSNDNGMNWSLRPSSVESDSLFKN